LIPKAAVNQNYCEKIEPTTGKILGFTPLFNDTSIFHILASTFDDHGSFWVITADRSRTDVTFRLTSYNLDKNEMLSSVVIDQIPSSSGDLYGLSMVFDAEKEVFYTYHQIAEPSGSSHFEFGTLDMRTGHFHAVNESALTIGLAWGP
jgi:hypothetical protein